MYENKRDLRNESLYKKVREVEPEEIKFINRETKEDVTYNRLLLLMSKTESTRGDSSLLNRIIKNGGFINYINWLESHG